LLAFLIAVIKVYALEEIALEVLTEEEVNTKVPFEASPFHVPTSAEGTVISKLVPLFWPPPPGLSMSGNISVKAP